MKILSVLGAALAALLTAFPAYSDDGSAFFKDGLRAEREGNDIKAYLLYMQARAKDPGRHQYVLAARKVQRRASQTLAGLGNHQAALALDPANQYLNADAAAPAAQPLAPPLPPRPQLRSAVELAPLDRISSFRLRDTAKTLYQGVAEAYGMEVIFDADFQDSEKIRFELDNADFSDAIYSMIDVTKTIVVPVTPKLFLVAEDTPQNRKDLEPMAVLVLPLGGSMSREQAIQLVKAVQQTLDIKRLVFVASRQEVIMRDTLAKLRLARALFEQLSAPPAEVAVDVELITLADSREITAGLSLPTSFPVANFSTLLWNRPGQPDGSVLLLGIGGGGTVFGLSVMSSAVTARKLSSLGKVRSSFTVRATEGTPADFLLGERYPIITARFSGPASSGQGGAFGQGFPSFTFEDLGLVFKVTPYVHSAREVSLEIELGIKQLTGQSVNDLPILSNLQLKTFVRLREGEMALLTGMVIVEDRKSFSGPAFLAQIPWLGWLFRRTTSQVNKEHLLITVRPRIVRLPPAETAPSMTLRYGPELRPLPAL